jgi:predicted nucleic acid-binding protein
LIAFDTNVMIRLLVHDDPQQATEAERLVREAAAAGETVFLGVPVLCEIVWVLRSPSTRRRERRSQRPWKAFCTMTFSTSMTAA